MARITLVDPPGWQGAAAGQRPSPNIGVAYLVAALRRGGHEVQVVDLNNQAVPADEAVALILAGRPEVVGFSVKTATMRKARDLGTRLRRAAPDAVILLGGPHVSVRWEQLRSEMWLDYLFLGEAEVVLPQIADRLAAKEELDDVACVVARVTPGICRHHHSLVDDLDALDFPAFDAFPAAVRLELARSYPLVTSRGCPYRCIYCSVPAISGRRVRTRSVPRLLAELRIAVERYSTTTFEIIDDSFNARIQHSKEFCRALIAERLDLSWDCPNGIRVDRVDEELAGLMVEAGCRMVMVGVESADDAILAAVEKQETLEDIERGLGILRAAGLEVGGFFIIGLPGDSIEATERSVEFVERTGINAHFNMLVPYPGTALWDYAHAHGRFLRDIEDGSHFADTAAGVRPVFETDDFTAAQRLRAYELANTRLGRLDAIRGTGLSPWRWRFTTWRLLWVYDRRSLVPYIRLALRRRLGAVFGRLLALRRRKPAGLGAKPSATSPAASGPGIGAAGTDPHADSGHPKA